MNVILRRATAADLTQVSALLERYYAEWDIWQRDPETKVRADLNHPTLGFFVAELDGTLGGCVLCRPLPSIPGAVECKRLYVTSEHRGHRLADRLMQALEDTCRELGHDWVYLDTKPEFAAAIALYRRRGYVDCARYNDNAQATLFLRRSLREPS